jgi:hypothetical protein
VVGSFVNNYWLFRRYAFSVQKMKNYVEKVIAGYETAYEIIFD